jgi:hypothetical protein
MRDITIVQAEDEIEILDKISDNLSDTLRAGYNHLRANSPAIRHSGGDIEIEAKLHNISLRLLDALEEVGRRGYGLLQDRHGPLNIHNVPARHKGDHGLDYYSLEDQVSYQCYAVQEPCEVADRADKQKAKITTDLRKFCANKTELGRLFGSVQMSRWVLVVPLHDSSQVNAHTTAKTTEVKALGLPHVASNFEVMIQDVESFDSTSRAVRAILRRSISLPVQPASSQQIEQWSEASESLVTTLKTKLGKRIGEDEEKLSESVGEAIQWFLDRENTLETLRGTFPELHEALMGVILRHGQRLSLYGPPADGAAHQILRVELEALMRALKEIPNVTDAGAHQLALGTLADWLMRCPLDFPPYNHAS